MSHLIRLSSVLSQTKIDEIKKQVTFQIMNDPKYLKNHPLKIKPKDIIPDNMYLHVMLDVEIKKPIKRVTSENTQRRIFEDLVGFTL